VCVHPRYARVALQVARDDFLLVQTKSRGDMVRAGGVAVCAAPARD